MTYVPGSLGTDAWNRLVQLHPQEEGEAPSAWVQRLESIASKRTPAEEPARLPYSEPREPGSDDAA